MLLLLLFHLANGSLLATLLLDSAADASRGSKVQTLLDENFTQDTQGLPTPLDFGSHVWLFKSVGNDTKFLSEVSVIDYSLLVGFQNEHQKGHLVLVTFLFLTSST